METDIYNMERLLSFIITIGPARLLSIALPIIMVLGWFSRWILDPLRRIPGPFLARFSRLWLLHEYLRGDFHRTNIDLHRKYGPIVRLAPGQYSINDPDSARIIYGHGTEFFKGDWYLPWGHPSVPNLFNEVDPSKHRMMRRQVSSLYSMSSLVSYEPYVDECMSLLCARLSQLAHSGASVDMRHWFQCYAFDVIGLITFSKRFGCLDAGQDIGGVMEALGKQNLLASAIGLFPSWYPMLFNILSRQSTKSQGDPQGPARITSFAREAIDSRRHSDPEAHSDDFIAKVLRKNSEGGPGTTSTETLLVTAGANVAAGSDTTAISLSPVLYYLCLHPETLQKLRAELKPVCGPGASPLTFQKTQALPYLQAVIKEALRMHPATGFTVPRVVPPGGRTLAGEFFPEETTVGINPWVAHRNYLFGADADVFRPERWLKSEKSCDGHLMDAYFFAFGQGARICIGKNISLLEVSKCIPRVVQQFDFELVGPKQLQCVNHWFVKPTELRFRVTERSQRM